MASFLKREPHETILFNNKKNPPTLLNFVWDHKEAQGVLAIMKYSSGSSMSSTISSPSPSPPSPPSPPRAPTLQRRQIVSGTRHAQCTHTTMTRLWTEEYRCSFCLKTGNMGWIWRCTQDREMLIEDDLREGRQEHIDDFSRNFPLSKTSRKLSPETRINGLTFLDEITTDQFKGYTTDQVVKIMEQRTEVLKSARAKRNLFLDSRDDLEGLTSNKDQSLISRFSETVDPMEKGWLPKLGSDECQFKCCQKCRSNCRERSYISLDAIAKGEYPATAITGFGFHLKFNERPVISPELIRNIGLRPSSNSKAAIPVPPGRKRSDRTNSHRGSQSGVSKPVKSSPFNDEQSADTTFSQPPAAHFYDSTAMTRSLNVETSARSSFSGPSTPEVFQTFKNMFSRQNAEAAEGIKEKLRFMGPKRELPNPPMKKSTSTPPLRNAVIDTPLGKAESVKRESSRRKSMTPESSRRQSPSKRSIQEERKLRAADSRSNQEDRNIRAAYTRDTHPEASDISLQRTGSEPITPTRSSHHSSSNHVHKHPTPGHKRVPSSPVNKPDRKRPGTPKQMTTMEIKEDRERNFTDEPLEVEDGVAVTEEAVALHIPDVITQF